MYTRNGYEHMRIRAVVFRFPDDYRVSNEIFSPEAFIGTDPRSKMIMRPCTISYTFEGFPVSNSYFRGFWRFNKIMTDPLITSATRSHHEESLNDLKI